ncbi:MAG: sodium ion-translocating decarboxylase subunit beta [Bacillota bacterium]|jgi:oxaloacetate decarboxylase beta subunit|nr:sodium ion-translocating decarboxylase subunit beta [Bacillota bacterium]
MLDLLIGNVLRIDPGSLVMVAVGIVLLYLAIVRSYEPMLLIPIGFGAILANIPGSSAVGEHGFLTILYDAGIVTDLFPILIFIGVGAMIDFGPLLSQPEMFIFGASAQFGIFFTMIVAARFGFSLREAASIGVIGAADGPTSIYVASRFAPHLLGPISVAAYSYMSMVPIIQPPVIRALTTSRERKIRVQFESRSVSKFARVAFPVLVTLTAGIVAPESVALVGALMFGNLLRESGVTPMLSKSAQNELVGLVTLLLGITVGSSMKAETFLRLETLLVLGMGLVAFAMDTAGGVLFAKLLNLFLPRKINPMIGACGISAFPMSARIVHKMGLEEDPHNFLLMQAVGANVAGQIASVVAGSLLLALIR